MKKYMLFGISIMAITITVAIANGYTGTTKSKGGCPCCSGGISKKTADSKTESSKKMVFNYYVKKYGDRNVEIEIKDFGCHMEAYVTKGNKLIKKLSIDGNKISEIK